MNNSFSNVEEYIAQFPDPVRTVLNKVRASVKKAAPHAQESVSYGMPAYRTEGKPLVYFAAFKNHIGFYATPTGHALFKDELSVYKHGKGSVQFPLNKPVPFKLIEAITKFRVKKNASLKNSLK